MYSKKAETNMIFQTEINNVIVQHQKNKSILEWQQTQLNNSLQYTSICMIIGNPTTSTMTIDMCLSICFFSQQYNRTVSIPSMKSNITKQHIMSICCSTKEEAPKIIEITCFVKKMSTSQHGMLTFVTQQRWLGMQH